MFVLLAIIIFQFYFWTWVGQSSSERHHALFLRPVKPHLRNFRQEVFVVETLISGLEPRLVKLFDVSLNTRKRRLEQRRERLGDGMQALAAVNIGVEWVVEVLRVSSSFSEIKVHLLQMNAQDIKQDRKTFSLTYLPVVDSFVPISALFFAHQSHTLLCLVADYEIRVYQADLKGLCFLSSKRLASRIKAAAKWKRGLHQKDQQSILLLCEPSKIIEIVIRKGSLYKLATVSLINLQKFRRFGLQSQDSSLWSLLRVQQERMGWFGVYQFKSTLVLCFRKHFFNLLAKDKKANMQFLPKQNIHEFTWFQGQGLQFLEVDTSRLGFKRIVDFDFDTNSATSGIYFLSQQHIDQGGIWTAVCQISFLKLSTIFSQKQTEKTVLQLNRSTKFFPNDSYRLRCLKKGGILIFSDLFIGLISAEQELIYALKPIERYISFDIQIEQGIFGSSVNRLELDVPFNESFVIGIRGEFYLLSVQMSNRSKQMYLRKLQLQIQGSIVSTVSKSFGGDKGLLMAISNRLTSKAFSFEGLTKFKEIWRHHSLAHLTDFIFLNKEQHFESPLLLLSQIYPQRQQLNLADRFIELSPCLGTQLRGLTSISVAEKHRMALCLLKEEYKLLKFNQQGSYECQIKLKQPPIFMGQVNFAGKMTVLLLFLRSISFRRGLQQVGDKEVQLIPNRLRQPFQVMGTLLFIKGSDSIQEIQMFSADVIRSKIYLLKNQQECVDCQIIQRSTKKLVFSISIQTLSIYQLGQVVLKRLLKVQMANYGLSYLSSRNQYILDRAVNELQQRIDMSKRGHSTKQLLSQLAVISATHQIVIVLSTQSSKVLIYKGRLQEGCFYRQSVSIHNSHLQSKQASGDYLSSFQRNIFVRDQICFVRKTSSSYSLAIVYDSGKLLFKNVTRSVPILTKDLNLLISSMGSWFSCSYEKKEWRPVVLKQLKQSKVTGLDNLSFGNQALIVVQTVNLSSNRAQLIIYNQSLEYLCLIQLQQGMRIYCLKTTSTGMIAVSCYHIIGQEYAVTSITYKVYLYILQSLSGQIFSKIIDSREFSKLITCIDQVGKYRLLLTEGSNFVFVDTSLGKLERTQRVNQRYPISSLSTWPFSDFVVYSLMQGNICLGRHSEGHIEQLCQQNFRSVTRFSQLIFIGKFLKVLVIDGQNNMFLFSVTKEGKLLKVADCRLPSRPTRLHKFERQPKFKSFYFSCQDGKVYACLPFYSQENIFLSLQHTMTQMIPEFGGLQVQEGICLDKKTFWMTHRGNILNGQKFQHFLQLNQAARQEVLDVTGVQEDQITKLSKDVLVF